MYVNFLTKVTVVETAAPKKQSAIIATVSNIDGTCETLAVKQVDDRLEDAIKAAIEEAQATLSDFLTGDIVTDASEEDVTGIGSTEEIIPEQAVPQAVVETIGESNEDVSNDIDDGTTTEMAIPDSESEISALLSNFSGEAGAETAEAEAVEVEPETVSAEATTEVVNDDATAESTAKVETAESEDDFMVTIGVHVSSPMMVSECAYLLKKNNQQERKMLRQAVATVAYAKTRGSGNPDIIKQAEAYIAYMTAKGLYKED